MVPHTNHGKSKCLKMGFVHLCCKTFCPGHQCRRAEDLPQYVDLRGIFRVDVGSLNPRADETSHTVTCLDTEHNNCFFFFQSDFVQIQTVFLGGHLFIR